MTGVEFNKDGYTAKTSTHLLGVDLKAPIDPSLDIKQLIAEIRAQGGLAIASHPHEMKSEWGKNTLYLWEHVDEYAPLIDAWEVANRDDIFNPVGLKNCPSSPAAISTSRSTSTRGKRCSIVKRKPRRSSTASA